MPTTGPQPWPDQDAALASGARVRVVRAAPGSGKTWLVAEALRRELAGWTPGAGGIAALSFTRVGGEEICRALGRELTHPHFVGTLDAFLFRYVVRPHIRRLDPQAKPLEVVTSEWAPREELSRELHQRGLKPYACIWVGEDANGRPVLAQGRGWRGLQVLKDEDRRLVVECKQRLRRTRGRVTPSDVALLASKLLADPVHGPVVCAEVLRRFPFLIIDELQDTGFFHGRALLSLLSELSARALVVGDPDQAIYEFNGATPHLFEDFEALADSEALALSTSLRCPPAVVAVARELRDSATALRPAEGRSGRAFLVPFDRIAEDVAQVAQALRAVRPGAVVKVVTRANDTINEITGRSGCDAPQLHSRPALLLHRGAQAFRQRRNTAALAQVRWALEQAILGGDGWTDAELLARGIAADEWKALAIRTLLRVNALPTDRSAREWQITALEVLREESEACAARAGVHLPAAGLPQPQRRAGHDDPASSTLPSPDSGGEGFRGVPVVTVHGVKGETHDATIVVCKHGNAAKCPSVTWWPASGADTEERRIAYVAVTRSRGDLVLCVERRSYDRLAETRPQFVSLFELTTPEGIGSLLRESGAPAIG